MAVEPPAEIDRYALIAAVFERLPQIKTLGIRVISVERGSSTMCMDYRDDLVGNPRTGVLHGGVVTTLLDSVAGAAAFTLVAPGSTLATLDLRIDYLRPALPRERLFGFAEVYRQTSNVAFVRGHAYQDEPGTQVASATATFMVGSVGFSPSF